MEDATGMRSVTVLVQPRGQHPMYNTFGEDSDIVREQLYHLNILEDGTMVILGRIRGNIEAARITVDQWEGVIDYSFSTDDSGGALVYVHGYPPSEVTKFLQLPREQEVFIDFPIEGVPDGGLRVVLIGETNELLQKAIGSIPEEFDLTVERIGAYPHDEHNPAGVLTERQREVLTCAREMGYYDVPRRTTHKEIADRLDLSVGTVGEHLQKIEARIIGGTVP